MNVEACMVHVSHQPRRRSLRLRGYDYAQAGAYFVTMCTQGHHCLFGEARGDSIRLNEAGQMLADLWMEIPSRFRDVALDSFIVMPNHVHGIVMLPDRRDGTRAGPVAGDAVPALGSIMGAFKSATTLEYIRGVRTRGWPPFRRHLWQRNYYEHVIRNQTSLDSIRRYVAENPARWAFDKENPFRDERSDP
jgi:REP element-mobilizing transposase RayT